MQPLFSLKAVSTKVHLSQILYRAYDVLNYILKHPLNLLALLIAPLSSLQRAVKHCFQTLFTSDINSRQMMQIQAQQEIYTMPPILMQIHIQSYFLCCLEQCMLIGSRSTHILSRQMLHFKRNDVIVNWICFG